LVRFLVRSQRVTVLNIDKLTYAGCLASLAAVERDNAYSFLKKDICDAEAMQVAFAEFQPDAVIHLAAESHVDRSIADPMAFVQTNVVGTATLLQVTQNYWEHLPEAKKKRFRFLHVSTDEVFGALGTDGYFDETTPYRPNSPYAASKAGADHLVRAWHVTHGLPMVVTNCSNNYGPYQFPEKLIPRLITNALEGEPLPIYRQGLNVRDWLYVEDHIEALWAVLRHGRLGETYAIGGNGERRNIEVAEAVCDNLDRLRPRAGGGSYREQIRFVRDRPGHDWRYAIDSSKLRRELGWAPRHDFESGLVATVAWYIDHEAWWRAVSAHRRGLRQTHPGTH
jgi:dTDP-glucose 4,6-dehydratase